MHDDAERLAAAEAALGVRFRDRELLRRALTHRSYVNELGRDPRDSNERLEFLAEVGAQRTDLCVVELGRPCGQPGEELVADQP